MLTAILISVMSYRIEVLVSISPIINYAGHRLTCLMALCTSLERRLFMFSACFCLGCLIFWYWAPWAVFVSWSLSLVGRDAAADTWLLFTGTELKHGGRILTEAGNDSFISLPSKGRHSRRMLSRPCPTFRGLLGSLTALQEQGMISLWAFFWFFGDGVIKESESSTLWFQLPWGLLHAWG